MLGRVWRRDQRGGAHGACQIAETHLRRFGGCSRRSSPDGRRPPKGMKRVDPAGRAGHRDRDAGGRVRAPAGSGPSIQLSIATREDPGGWSLAMVVDATLRVGNARAAHASLLSALSGCGALAAARTGSSTARSPSAISCRRSRIGGAGVRAATSRRAERRASSRDNCGRRSSPGARSRMFAGPMLALDNAARRSSIALLVATCSGRIGCRGRRSSRSPCSGKLDPRPCAIVAKRGQAVVVRARAFARDASRSPGIAGPRVHLVGASGAVGRRDARARRCTRWGIAGRSRGMRARGFIVVRRRQCDPEYAQDSSACSRRLPAWALVAARRCSRARAPAASSITWSMSFFAGAFVVGLPSLRADTRRAARGRGGRGVG